MVHRLPGRLVTTPQTVQSFTDRVERVRGGARASSPRAWRWWRSAAGPSTSTRAWASQVVRSIRPGCYACGARP